MDRRRERWGRAREQRVKGDSKTNPFLNEVNPNVTNMERG